MKKDEVLQKLAAGAVGVLGEVRAAKADGRTGVGAKSGKPYSMAWCDYRIEMGPDGCLEVAQPLPDGTDPVKYVPPFVRGDKVWAELSLERIEGARGHWRVRIKAMEKVA